MAVRILSNDLVNPELATFITPHDGGKEKALRPAPDAAYTGVTGLAGALHITGIPAPGLMGLDIHWHTGNEAIYMTDKVPSRNINIQFQVCGQMQARFTGLSHTLDMLPNRHNLIYAPEGGDETYIDRNMALELLHISIDRQHFGELIGADTAWAESVQKELTADRPFSGIWGTGAVTPAMQQLIQAIRNPAITESGPMRRLQVQARMLELLSLQFGQFAAAATGKGSAALLSLNDTEKLQQLRLYLDIHFLEEDLSLAGLARRFLLNEFKLKQGFKALFGITVFGYIKELRMGHALILLRDCGQSVEEAACTLGYEHPQHFSAAFKKHFGKTPGVWGKA